MSTLYVGSVGTAGKTALCAGIGKKLVNEGRKVGFLMPVHLDDCGGKDGCRDAAFLKEALGLPESVRQLCPARLSEAELRQALAGGGGELILKLKQVHADISRDKEFILVEGPDELDVEGISGTVSYPFVEALDARVVVLLRYSSTLKPSAITPLSNRLGDRLLGVIVNFAPEFTIGTVRPHLTALFREAGVNVLGVLPEVAGLLGVGVGELAGVLEGEVLTGKENIDRLVESVMLGAMTLDSGLDYFRRKDNKAAVIRGERADMQLAALETSTACLILTGNVKPLPAVVHRAEEKRVPVVAVRQDIPQVIAAIEKVLEGAGFRSLQKLRNFEGVLDSFFDFKALRAGLGLGR